MCSHIHTVDIVINALSQKVSGDQSWELKHIGDVPSADCLVHKYGCCSYAGPVGGHDVATSGPPTRPQPEADVYCS